MMKSRKSIRTQSRVVLAIDPGFDRLGVAVLRQDGNKTSLLFSECVRTNSKEPREQRLLTIGSRLRAIIKKWQPTSLAIETLFFNTNTTSAIGVAEARGVVIYEAARVGLTVSEYGPQTIKVAVTGYGKADKLQMKSMVKRLIVLPVTSKKRLDDELDAIAVGITHLASHQDMKN